MLPNHKGSIRSFRFQGIDVWLHWSWFLFAIYRINLGGAYYSSYIWAVWQYLALFGIVVFHEFGHALACRSVGGRADEIVLWPLGGVAYVDPPKRPGATLWSLAAGPLVNVMFVPVFSVCWIYAKRANLEFTQPDLYHLVENVWLINLLLLCFNMLPIFPLDGGQILGALLWYWVGRARSLRIVTLIGIGAAGTLLLLALMIPAFRQNPWLLVIAIFALFQSWSGLQYARQMVRLEAAPRHAGLACPTCGAAPRVGDFWLCGRCRIPFDMFAAQGICPHCGVSFNGARCMECGQGHPLQAFFHSQS